jgi:hypothetical protein
MANDNYTKYSINDIFLVLVDSVTIFNKLYNNGRFNMNNIVTLENILTNVLILLERINTEYYVSDSYSNKKTLISNFLSNDETQKLYNIDSNALNDKFEYELIKKRIEKIQLNLKHWKINKLIN